MKTWRCLPISETSCPNGDWNVSMQKDMPLNINDNRLQYVHGGSVIPSQRVSTYMVVNTVLGISSFSYCPAWYQ